MVQFQKPRKYYPEMFRRYHLPGALLEDTVNPLNGPYWDYFATTDGLFNGSPYGSALPQSWNSPPSSVRSQRTPGERSRPKRRSTNERGLSSQVSLQSYSQRPLTQQSMGAQSQSQYDRYSLPPLSQDSTFGDSLTFDNFSSQPTGVSQHHLSTQDSLC